MYSGGVSTGGSSEISRLSPGAREGVMYRPMLTSGSPDLVHGIW